MLCHSESQTNDDLCFAAGDVFEEINLCEKKIAQMQEEVLKCMESDEEMGPHTEDKLGTDAQVATFSTSDSIKLIPHHPLQHLVHCFVF